MLCHTELLRHRESQIEALTTYLRDPQWSGVSNHDNDDELDMDQLIAIVDQQQRWHGGASAGNCSDGRPNRPGAETGKIDGDSDVSANRRQNLTEAGDIGSRDECPEITIPEKAGVTDSHHRVAYALHLASTIILGLLVLEVSNIIYAYICCVLLVTRLCFWPTVFGRAFGTACRLSSVCL